MSQQCSSCGEQLLVKTKSCAYCGAELQTESIPSPSNVLAPHSIFIDLGEVDGQTQPITSSTTHEQKMKTMPLKYSPKPNLRTRSYIIIAIGIFQFFASMMLWLYDVEIAMSICCFSLIIGAFMDAAYYSGRIEWEQNANLSTKKSEFGRFIDNLSALIFFILYIFYMSISGW